MRLFATTQSFVLFFCLFALILTAYGQNVSLQPTTTLAAETGNNTSTAAAFASQTNGNAGPGNVSKLPISSLLYPGATTRIYAHFMPWFGGSNHMDVRYNSTDPVQVRRQVDDMLSRGIRGVIIDWYGPDFSLEQASTAAMQREAEARNGDFEFAVMEDAGALGGCMNTSGCDVTALLVRDLTFAYNNFEISPTYMRMNGRPVVFFFGVDQNAIDWGRVRDQVPGNPLFIFQGAGSFTSSIADGGFNWVGLTGDPTFVNVPYLDYFYEQAQQNSDRLPFASTYKGFNDSLASWSPTPPRILNQDCGQTWLRTFAEINRYYNASRQLAALQLVTWNDYEEATELESGIDNCVTVNATTNGSQLAWAITGNEAAVDHYTVFASSDGVGLSPLGDTTSHAFDLTSVNLPAGSYQLFVKAVGRAGIRNQMSAPVNYAAAPTPAAQPTLTATPQSVVIARGQSANVQLSLNASSGSVSFACSGLPPGASCSFSSGRAASDGNTAATLTISTVALSAALTPTSISFAALAGLPAVLLLGVGATKRHKFRRAALLITMAATALAQVSCGGSRTMSTVPSPASSVAVGSYTVTVTASTGAAQHTTQVQLVVQ